MSGSRIRLPFQRGPHVRTLPPTLYWIFGQFSSIRPDFREKRPGLIITPNPQIRPNFGSRFSADLQGSWFAALAWDVGVRALLGEEYLGNAPTRLRGASVRLASDR